MAYIVTAEAPIQKIAPPALPLAGDEYSRQYQDQLNNTLRLYFNLIQGILVQLHSDAGFIPAANVYLVANLPSAATSGVGSRAFVSNALAPSFGVTVAGGGTVAVPIYSDGTTWKVG